MRNKDNLNVKPLMDYQLLGTNEALDSNKIYTAVHATNQPDWQRRGLIFVDGFLLEHGEYEIVAKEQQQ